MLSFAFLQYLMFASGCCDPYGIKASVQWRHTSSVSSRRRHFPFFAFPLYIAAKPRDLSGTHFAYISIKELCNAKTVWPSSSVFMAGFSASPRCAAAAAAGWSEFTWHFPLRLTASTFPFLPLHTLLAWYLEDGLWVCLIIGCADGHVLTHPST